VATSAAVADTDALPSWNDGPAKSAIIEFVQTATDEANMKFVSPAQRIPDLIRNPALLQGVAFLDAPASQCGTGSSSPA